MDKNVTMIEFINMDVTGHKLNISCEPILKDPRIISLKHPKSLSFDPIVLKLQRIYSVYSNFLTPFLIQMSVIADGNY